MEHQPCVAHETRSRSPARQPQSSPHGEVAAAAPQRARRHLAPWGLAAVVGLGVAQGGLCWGFVARLYPPAIDPATFAQWDRTPAFACLAGAGLLACLSGLVLHERRALAASALAAFVAWLAIVVVASVADGSAGWLALALVATTGQFLLVGLPVIALGDCLGRWLRRVLARAA